MPVEDQAELLTAWAEAEAHAATRPDPVAENDHLEQATGRDEKGRFQKGATDGEASKEPAASGVAKDAGAGATAADLGKNQPVARGSLPAKHAAKPGSDAGASSGGNDSQGMGPGLAELRELAQKHGFAVEDGKVVPRERAAFREERREARAKLAQDRETFERERQQTVERIRGQVAPLAEAIRLKEAGDYDGFARMLGHKDWNDLNGEVIGRFADPNFKRTLELEQRLKEREASDQRQREQGARVQAAQAEARAQAEYKANLSAEMATSSDPFIAAMADDPAFVAAIFRIQEAHFDGVETISVEEAVRLKPKQGGSPLLEELRALYQRLDKSGVFKAQDESGTRSAASSAPPRKGGGSRVAQSPAKQAGTTAISQKDATEAAGQMQFKDDQDFIRYGARLLEEAAAEERKARAG